MIPTIPDWVLIDFNWLKILGSFYFVVGVIVFWMVTIFDDTDDYDFLSRFLIALAWFIVVPILLHKGKRG